MSDAGRLDDDPVIELYKRDVDRTLFERNLRLTPGDRLEQLQQFVQFLYELRQAGCGLRDEPHSD